MQRFLDKDADECYDVLQSRIIENQRETIPMKDKRTEKEGMKPRWYTNEIGEAIKERD